MSKNFKTFGIIFILFTLISGFLFVSFSQIIKTETGNERTYTYREYPLICNNIKLHLDRIDITGHPSKKNILLVHGLTYSSHEFDINYKDYSLVRALAREGYSVWRLDIAGYGRSGEVADGFLPNSDYATEDINAAVEKIKQVTGQDKIDLLGWSWGTVTTSKFASKHNEHLNKLVLFAPIMSGIGKSDIKEPFHHNTWEHSVEDFQHDKNGNIDYSITEPIFAELWALSCRHYDGKKSPNGGRRDICVDSSKKLIDFSLLKIPTLVIYGDKDPYLNYKLINTDKLLLPKGSSVKIIKGGSHVVFVEKPYHKEFQKILVNFLNNKCDN